ncbi:hypothetical protein GCM10012278_69050 [Nonomuraea glycinis]|uniref:Tyr recombinase domain-containing protein n=2 Tax=Nonomuraea glycinis TaxID=2047744 RepID=A0A918AEQ2_9ACTN|nr:hypothetical protein GCM10012278_69050 [Nonomuraea glycinis]
MGPGSQLGLGPAIVRRDDAPKLAPRALDDNDVPLSARKGKVIVRSGKGETSREIPLLDGTARASVTEWRTERASWPGAADNPALLLNRRGGRLSTRAVDQLVDELATDADLEDAVGRLPTDQ